MNDVLRALKTATQAHHHEAERHVRILDDDACVGTYVRYLRGMLGFHAPIEERFARHTELLALGFEPAIRRKQDLLRADLSSLGSTELEVRCTELPDIDDVARALGAAYVIEGSTLGGRFILRKLPRRLAPLAGRATRFLEGYRAETGRLWRSFAAIAERAIRESDARARAIASAQATFEALTGWLREAHP